MRIPDETIDRIREATDIVAVVSEHVQLKRSGRTWKALCPFHQEKTPSFHVNPDRQIFKCFGCGQGGDVFRFLMEFEKLSFPEAVEVLAEASGVPLPKRGWTGPEEESVYPTLEWAASFYRKELSGRTGEAARRYLERRGFEAGVLERFGVGWAPPGWSGLLNAGGQSYSPALLLRAGLIAQNEQGGHYDRFRGRVMIPIRSPLGRTIGFGARTLGDEEPKYLNSPETEVFHKSRVLYGLSESREMLKQADEVLVVEGYMDLLALAQNGVDNVVASCGTALTEDQARIMRRYVKRAVLLFDGDLAGIRAAWKSAGIFLGEGLDVRVVSLPEGHDPDSFVRDRGKEALTALCAGAPGVVAFARETLMDRLETREDLLKAFAYLGSRIGDPIRRRVILQEAAEQLRFDEETLVREAARLTRMSVKNRRPPEPTTPEEAPDRLGRQYLALLLGGDAVAEVDLVPTDILREGALRELYDRWRALRNDGEEHAGRRLLDDENHRSLVSEILAGDLGDAGGPELIARLRERVTVARGRELQEAIREAESRGDRDRVDHLLKELHSLKEARG